MGATVQKYLKLREWVFILLSEYKLITTINISMLPHAFMPKNLSTNQTLLKAYLVICYFCLALP